MVDKSRDEGEGKGRGMREKVAAVAGYREEASVQ